jgi:hypothetical protein
MHSECDVSTVGHMCIRDSDGSFKGLLILPGPRPYPAFLDRQCNGHRRLPANRCSYSAIVDSTKWPPIALKERICVCPEELKVGRTHISGFDHRLLDGVRSRKASGTPYGIPLCQKKSIWLTHNLPRLPMCGPDHYCRRRVPNPPPRGRECHRL